MITNLLFLLLITSVDTGGPRIVRIQTTQFYHKGINPLGDIRIIFCQNGVIFGFHRFTQHDFIYLLQFFKTKNHVI